MHKILKKLVCIKTFNENLTIGKTYNILLEGTIGGIPVYYVEKDSGYKDWVISTSFESIEDMREEKINKILI